MKDETALGKDMSDCTTESTKACRQAPSMLLKVCKPGSMDNRQCYVAASMAETHEHITTDRDSMQKDKNEQTHNSAILHTRQKLNMGTSELCACVCVCVFASTAEHFTCLSVKAKPRMSPPRAHVR